MEFRPDGSLQYWLEQPDGRLQIFNLLYQVTGDIITSDQPSSPNKQHTRFALGPMEGSSSSTAGHAHGTRGFGSVLPTRVQRTRSSASRRRSPLTRHPLGVGRR
jgi:hypothetical protein